MNQENQKNHSSDNNKIIEWVMRNRQIILLLVAVLFVAGIYSLAVMPKQEMPEFIIRQGVVIGVYPGASSLEVEEQLTKPLERYLFTCSEVKREKTTSKSEDGIACIFVELADDVKDKNIVWSKIKPGLTVQIIFTSPQGDVVRVKDIGRMVREYPDADSYITHNGRRCVLLSVEVNPSANILFFGRDVNEVIENYKSELPESVNINRIVDQPKVVDASINRQQRTGVFQVDFFGNARYKHHFFPAVFHTKRHDLRFSGIFSGYNQHNARHFACGGNACRSPAAIFSYQAGNTPLPKREGVFPTPLEGVRGRSILDYVQASYEWLLGKAFAFPKTTVAIALASIVAGGQIVNGNRLARAGVEASALQRQMTENETLLTTERLPWFPSRFLTGGAARTPSKGKNLNCKRRKTPGRINPVSCYCK